ncbi:MFS transporter [Clostridium sp. JNZ X4-2]
MDKKVNNIMFPVVMLSLALGLRQISMTIVTPFISTYCKNLIGYTPLLAGLAVGAFGLMQAIFQIPFGILSDRFGNKKIMIGGLSLVVVGLVLAYFANNIGLLIFARALQGSGAVIGVGYSWIAGLADDSNRTKAMSIMGAFISAAAALAFGVGPLLRGVMSVSWMFMAGAILLFANELYILFFIKDTKSSDNNNIPQGNDFHILLKNKTFVIMNLVAFINNFMMMSVFYAVPYYIDTVTGQAGMWKIFIPAIAAAIIVMKFSTKWADKGHLNTVLIGAFLISCVGILFFFEKNLYIFLLIGTTLFMCGYISIATIVATDVNNIVEDRYRGTANGIFNSFQYVGNFAGALVTGAVWSVSQTLAWILLFCVGIVGLLMIVFGKPQENKN